MIDVTIEPTQLFVDQANNLGITLTNSSVSTYTNIVLRINLPGHLPILEGNDRIMIPQLRAGESSSHKLVIRPKRQGISPVTVSNFSYLDSLNRSKRINGLELMLHTVPQPEIESVPEPKISIETETTGLPLRQWSVLSGRIMNEGQQPVYDINVKAMGPITLDRNRPYASIDSLMPNQTRNFQLSILANQPGLKVPIYVEATYLDSSGQRRKIKPQSTSINVNETPLKKETILKEEYNIHVRGSAFVTPHSDIHDNKIIQQNVNQGESGINLQQLASELSQLREYMRSKASEPDHDIALGTVAQAEAAAKKGDEPGAIEHLRKAGKWTLNIAKLIGVELVASILKEEIGI